MTEATILDFNDTAPTVKPITIALSYAERGWPVFPCNPLNKRPLIEKGFLAASADTFKVRSWWSQWPHAMVGVPTGSKTGFWVLDIDTDEAKGKQGLANLADMGHDLAELMDTAVSRTGSGGYHCLFTFDEQHPITNARGDLPRHIDVRGEGGYIIAPGSRLSDGRTYEWLNPPDENEIGEAPEWLLSTIRGNPSVEPFDFNTAAQPAKTPAQRVAAIEPGTWHENTRDIVARLVREGASDDSIAAIAPAFTMAGYTDSQTVNEFLTHARTARAKWGYQPGGGPAGPVSPMVAAPVIDEKTGRRFKALDIDELANLEPLDWLIEGHLPDGAFVGLYGPPASLKSFVALDVALSIATGADWCGKAVKAGLAVYVAGEGQRGLAKRIIGWRKAKGADLPKPNFRLVPHSIGLPTDEGVELLELIMAMPERPKLIVLDTLARMFGPGDENVQRDMNAFVRAVDRLREATGAAVIVVHHTGKDETKGERGSSNFRGALDTSIFVRRRGKKVELINQAPLGKQKDADEFADLVMHTKTVVFDHAGQEEGTIILVQSDDTLVGQSHCDDNHEADQPQRLGTVEQSIMTALERAARDGQNLGFMRLGAVVSQLNKKPVNNGSLSRSIQNLIDKGLIFEVDDAGRKAWKCNL